MAEVVESAPVELRVNDRLTHGERTGRIVRLGNTIVVGCWVDKDGTPFRVFTLPKAHVQDMIARGTYSHEPAAVSSAASAEAVS